MPLDRSKLHKGFQIYLANAEKLSGKTWEDFALVLSKSGLKKHGELREHLMNQMGLGHGHANAVTAIWLLPGNSGPPLARETAPVKGPVVKAAAKPAPAKAPAKKPAEKVPAKPAKAPAKAAAKPAPAKPVRKAAAKKPPAKKK